MINKKVKIGIIASYLYNIVTSITGFIYAPILLRMMSDSEYGLYSIFISMIGYLSILQTVLGTTLIRYITKAYSDTSPERSPEEVLGSFIKLFSALSFIVLALGSVFVLLTPRIYAASMNLSEISSLQQIYTLLIVYEALNLPLFAFGSCVLAYERFAFYNIIRSLAAIFIPISTILLVAKTRSAISAAAAFVAVNTISNIGYMLYCALKLKLRARFAAAGKSYLREIFGFVWFLFIISLVDKTNWSLGTVLVGGTLGSAAAKNYNLGLQFGTYFTLIALTLTNTFLPNLTQIASECSEEETASRYTELMVRIGRIIFAAMGITAAFLTVLGRDFLLLWAATERADTYYVAVIIIFPALLECSMCLGKPMMQALGRHSYQAGICAAATALGIALSLILSRFYGIVGYAIGVAAALLSTSIAFSVFYQKKIGLDMVRFGKELARLVIPMLAAIAAAFFCTGLISGSGVIAFLIKTVIFGIWYIGLMWFFGLRREERNAALAWLRGKLKRKPQADEQ